MEEDEEELLEPELEDDEEESGLYTTATPVEPTVPVI